MRTPGHERPIYGTLSEVTSIATLCAALRTIESEWVQIVGVPLSKRSAPASYENGVLLVNVDCQAALQDMNFKKMALARSIRERSLLRVDEIRIEVGTPPRAARVPHGRNGQAAPVRTRKVDEAVVEALALEISREHPHIEPQLAVILARCRAMATIRD